MNLNKKKTDATDASFPPPKSVFGDLSVYFPIYII